MWWGRGEEFESGNLEYVTTLYAMVTLLSLGCGGKPRGFVKLKLKFSSRTCLRPNKIWKCSIFTLYKRESCSRREKVRCFWADISGKSQRRRAAPPGGRPCCTGRRRRSKWGPWCSQTFWWGSRELPASETLVTTTVWEIFSLTVWRAVDWLGRSETASWSAGSSSDIS